MKLFFCKILPLVALGMGAGFLNGLLGAGGGIVIVYGLTLLLGRRVADPRAVYVTALAVMLPLSALSLWHYAGFGHLPERELWLLLLPAVIGGVLGAWLLRRLTPHLLSRLFAAIVLLSGVMMVI